MLLPDAEYEYPERQVDTETVSFINWVLEEFVVRVPVRNAGTKGVARDLPPIKVLNSKSHLINFNRNCCTCGTQCAATSRRACGNSRA